jgi:hypothetical protein
MPSTSLLTAQAHPGVPRLSRHITRWLSAFVHRPQVFVSRFTHICSYTLTSAAHKALVRVGHVQNLCCCACKSRKSGPSVQFGLPNKDIDNNLAYAHCSTYAVWRPVEKGKYFNRYVPAVCDGITSLVHTSIRTISVDDESLLF